MFSRVIFHIQKYFFYSLGPQIAIHLKNALHFGFKEVFEDLRNN